MHITKVCFIIYYCSTTRFGYSCAHHQPMQLFAYYLHSVWHHDDCRGNDRNTL